MEKRVVKQDIVISENTTIELQNVVQINFQNEGAIDCKFGLITIRAGKSYTYSTGGYVNDNQKIPLIFTGGKGYLVLEIKKFIGCK